MVHRWEFIVAVIERLFAYYVVIRPHYCLKCAMKNAAADPHEPKCSHQSTNLYRKPTKLVINEPPRIISERRRCVISVIVRLSAQIEPICFQQPLRKMTTSTPTNNQVVANEPAHAPNPRNFSSKHHLISQLEGGDTLPRWMVFQYPKISWCFPFWSPRNLKRGKLWAIFKPDLTPVLPISKV